MAKTVYEGKAELNIQPFLTALDRLQKRVNAVSTQVTASFQQLDTSVNASVQNISNNLNNAAKSMTALGVALRNAMRAGQQQQQAQASTGSSNNAVAATMRAQEQAIRASYARQLASVKKGLADQVTLTKREMSEMERNAKIHNAEQLRNMEKALNARKAVLVKSLNEQRRIEDQARQRQQQALFGMADAQTAGDDKEVLRTKGVYQRSLYEAKEAVERQKALQRELTAVTKTEAAAQTQAMRLHYNAVQQSAHKSALAGKLGLRQQFQALQEELTKIEDRWNSVFRAGAQISSIGNSLSNFSQRVGQFGAQLSDAGGDFDFWIARTRAALQAANSDETIASVDNLRNATLELGRELGSLNPSELAEGWFTYQAALGSTIENETQFIQSQQAIQTMLKASIISASEGETVMRGVAGVLATYNEDTSQAAYATSVLMNVTQRTQAEFSDLLEGFKMVGSQAVVMGGTIAETSTIFSLMAEQNIKGSQAGRSLNQVYQSLIDSTPKADAVLNELLMTSQGLTGVWQDVAFEGGTFIGLLGEIDEAGNVVREGLVHKIVEPLLDLPAKVRDTKIAQAVAEIFPANAARGILPVMLRYAQAMADVEGGAEGAKNRVTELFAEFQNGEEQARLFGNQWKTIEESVRVRMDKATYGLREAAIRIGLIVAETFIPIMQLASDAAQAFANWADENPKLATTIVSIAAALTAVTAILGPILVGFGLILQGIAGWAVAGTALSGAMGILTNVVSNLGTVLGFVARNAIPLAIRGMFALGAPIWGLIALLVTLGVAWRQNIGGFGDFMNGLVELAGPAVAALGEIFNEGMGAIVGLVTGNNQLVAESFADLGPAIIELLLVIPIEAGRLFEQLAGSMRVWGYNLMVSLGNGIMDAFSSVMSMVGSIAEAIGSFFRSYSPPKYGPLKGIYDWGRNLITTYVQGMNSADIDAVSDIAGRIGDALTVNVKFGETTVDEAEALSIANELAAQMVGTVQSGGRVNEEFFRELQSGLGEWYEDIVEIMLAYQEVYAATQNLEAEEARLELIQQQREELEEQAQLRQDAFDNELRGSFGGSYQSNQQFIVDPNSDEGRAKIEEMKRTLTTEDFQNWVNFQKRMWQEKTDAEDAALKVEEDAAQSAYDNAQLQLEIAEAQHNYLVSAYEYAKGLLEEQEKLTSGTARSGGGGGGGAMSKKIGPDPADLEAERAFIRNLVGDDQAIFDEQQLREQAGGDDIRAIGGADAQQDREAERLKALDDENRRRRAKYETDLINATSEEERQRIKARMDAWDAAYKEEKARLTERRNLTGEITDAADQQAELSSSARIEAERAELEGQISEEMQGQLETVGDLAQEQKDLQDLRNIGDRKRLEFEERLRAAAGDEEATRRIKEEQQAWEEAYGAALQAQEERVQALRSVSSPSAGTPAGGVGGGGGFNIPSPDEFAVPEFVMPELEPIEFEMPWADKIEDRAIRPTLEKARKLWEDFQRGWDFLTDGGISIGQKWDELSSLFGSIVQEGTQKVLGVDLKAWGRDIAEGAAVVGQVFGGLKEDFDRGVDEVARGWSEFWGGLQQGWDEGVANVGGWWEQFSTNLQNGWTNNVVTPVSGWWGEVAATLEGWRVGFLQFVSGLGLFLVGLFAVFFWNPLVNQWQKLWPWLIMVWGLFVTAVSTAWALFWDNLKEDWDTFKEEVSEAWGQFWEALTNVWTAFSQALQVAWRLLWGYLKREWEAFRQGVEQAWKAFWDALTEAWNNFKDPLLEAWGQFWEALTEAWNDFKEPLEEAWGELWSGMEEAWNDFKDSVSESWKSFVEEFEGVIESIQKVLADLQDAFGELIDSLTGWVGDIISAGKEFLSNPFGGGADGEHSTGLYRVPFDGYRAVLHQGERVLTAQEANAYNAMEQGGLMRSLSNFVSRVSGAVSAATSAGAVAPAVADNSSVVNEGAVSRTTNITVGKIDATDPEAGKAFLKQLAFLS
jgi:TP901 family phage tail tape measure protein